MKSLIASKLSQNHTMAQESEPQQPKTPENDTEPTVVEAADNFQSVEEEQQQNLPRPHIAKLDLLIHSILRRESTDLSSEEVQHVTDTTTPRISPYNTVDNLPTLASTGKRSEIRNKLLNNGVSPRRIFYSGKLPMLTDQDIIKLGINLNDVADFRRKLYVDDYELVHWHSKCPNTPRTFPIGLSFEEANALFLSHGRPASEWTKVHQSILQDLERKIDTVLERHFPQGAFLKCNSTSCRDAVLMDHSNAEVRQTVRDHLDETLFQAPSRNIQAIQFIKAISSYCKVNNAHKALQLLTKSVKVHNELKKALKFGDKFFAANLYFREWKTELAEKPETEFRCFIVNNELSGISQYYDFVHFPSLNLNKSEIKDAISKCVKEVQQNLSSYQNYILDVYVGEEKPAIIDLNPFHETMHMCLFSDDEELLKQKNFFEFRVLDRLIENPLDQLPSDWKIFLQDNYPVQSGQSEVVTKPKKTSWEQWGIVVLGALIGFSFWKLSGRFFLN